MPTIVCNVNNCSHNNSGICYANKISVNGKKARTNNNTCCSTFLNQDTYSTLTNNTLDNGPCNSLGCNVKSCAHNVSGCTCNLHDIDITSNIEKTNLYSETYCNSFRYR